MAGVPKVGAETSNVIGEVKRKLVILFKSGEVRDANLEPRSKD